MWVGAYYISVENTILTFLQNVDMELFVPEYGLQLELDPQLVEMDVFLPKNNMSLLIKEDVEEMAVYLEKKELTMTIHKCDELQ